MASLQSLLIAIVLALAYANGANDNFKGVATLYGGGTLSYRQALVSHRSDAARLIGLVVSRRGPA
jgi:phosphate/sulfate permease